MFKKITNWLPGVLDNLPHISEFPDFESAKSAGLHDACLRAVMNVWIQECNDADDRGKDLASWSKLDNYWYDFKDSEGNFITPEKFFARERTRKEKFALSNDFNIRIRPDGMHFKVLAGNHCIPIERRMLPWVHEAVEEIQNKVDYREEDGEVPFTPEEKLTAFAMYLKNRVQQSLDSNPNVRSHLRYSGIYRK